MRKRLLAMVLCISVLIGLLPGAAFTATNTETVSAYGETLTITDVVKKQTEQVTQRGCTFDVTMLHLTKDSTISVKAEYYGEASIVAFDKHEQMEHYYFFENDTAVNASDMMNEFVKQYGVAIDQVNFSIQAAGAEYYFTIAETKASAAPSKPQPSVNPTTANASPTTSKIYVDGKEVAFDAYNINGNNYFKLRNVAYAVTGSEKQFNVTWNGANGCIDLISHAAYAANGSELKLGDGLAKKATVTTSPIMKDGVLVQNLAGYNINGNNFFKLRDLGQSFDFCVAWDDNLKSITIDTTKSYNE